jgi:hypothetical protein
VIKKLLEKIGLVLLGIILAAIALFSLFLGIGSAAELVVKIVLIFN